MRIAIRTVVTSQQEQHPQQQLQLQQWHAMYSHPVRGEPPERTDEPYPLPTDDVHDIHFSATDDTDTSMDLDVVMAPTTDDATGSDASLLSSYSFADGVPNFPDWLLQRCLDCGWEYPTVIQQRAFEAIASGGDVIVQAQTGSGKTLAFLLPVLAGLDPNRAAIQAVLVVPTRELGLQVGRVAKRLTAQTPIVVMNILEGSSNKRQRAWAWSEPPQIVIGTPQELTDMVEHGGIKYNAVKYVVVDEVDACLLGNGGSLATNSGPLHVLLSKHLSPTFGKAHAQNQQHHSNNNQNDPETVLQQRVADIANSNNNNKQGLRPLSQTRQTIFCSATIPQHRHFIKSCVQNQWTIMEPTYVCANPGDILPPTLSHSYLVVSSKEKKVSALRRWLMKKQGKIRKVLIFCEPNRPLEDMAQIIAKDLKGIVWKQGYGEEQERGNLNAIVSVLRYEDSVAIRSSAMLGFQGANGGVIEGRRQYPSGTRSSGDDGGGGNDIVQRHHTGDEAPFPVVEGASVAASSGPIRILLSTDHAARGLDVEDVTHVVQFDLPHSADTYVHRAGRTGRLGRDGWVLSIVTPDQEFVMERMTNKLGLTDIKCVGRQTV